MVHNFFAGPAILPQSVLKQAAAAINEFDNMGLSVLEISHRSTNFGKVMDKAESLTRELLGIGEEYAVLFLTGGASSQFYVSAMNLLGQSETACYIDTGTWSAKAIKEAKHFGNIEIAASSEDKGYTYVPKEYNIPQGAKYIHTTSNNTIYGTQFQDMPDFGIPNICDMSSDIFSKPIDMSKYDMIYAGAQKNLGPAGVTLVVIKKDLLGKVERHIPTMLDYRTHIAKGSMFNTPPAFPIYVCMLTMEWIVANGGLEAMQKKNESKAKLLYDEIDANPCFIGKVEAADRSRMNVTFLPTKEEYVEPFLAMCAENNCAGLKGHRSVGGFRASIYNAMEESSVQVLVDTMRAFAAKQA